MLNPIEEAKFADLRKKCQELGVPSPPEIHICFQVHDKDGNLTFEDLQRGHSWTRNFYNFLFSHTAEAGGSGSSNFGAGYLNSKNVSATIGYSANICGNRNQQYAVLSGGIHNSAVGLSGSGGLVVGTGSTAFSADNYILSTLIAHGNSASQLYYQAMVAPVTAYTAGTKTWKNTISRVFNNNSGGSITVAEVGIYWYGLATGTGSVANLLWERSVLAPTVAVPSGAQLTVTYEISMSFSAID